MQVRCVSFSADGQRAISGSNDKTLRMWDTGSGTCTRVMEGHTDYVRHVTWCDGWKRCCFSGLSVFDISICGIAMDWQQGTRGVGDMLMFSEGCVSIMFISFVGVGCVCLQ